MGLYYDEYGKPVQVDDGTAAAMGYRPVSADTVNRVGEGVAAQQAKDRSGLVGAVRAGLSSAAESATLGGTDWLLDQFLDPSEKRQLLTDIEAHPYVSGAGALAGAVLPSLVAPESLLGHTPAGYLGRAVTSAAEAGGATGIRGAAQAAGAFGVEGAIQNVGAYLGQAALADKEITAEGVAGAAGLGLEYGAGGGVAALGVAKGTIAARKLFSRTMARSEAKAAESAWSQAMEETKLAADASLDAAKKQLDDIAQAKIEAVKNRQGAAAARKEAQNYAETQRGQPRPPEEATASPGSEIEGPMPLDEGIEPARGGGQTSIYRREEIMPSDPHNAVDAADFDLGLPAEGGKQTQVKRVDWTPEGTKITGTRTLPKEEAAAPAYRAGTPATDLESQLAGTKAALDEGAALKDIKQPSSGHVNKHAMRGGGPGEARLPEYLFEGADDVARGETTKIIRESYGPTGPEMLPTKRAPFSNVRTQLAQQLLPEIRYAHTAELLGEKAAQREAELMDFVKSVEKAAADVEGFALPGAALTEKQTKQLYGRSPKLNAEEQAALTKMHEEARAGLGTHGGKPAHSRESIMERLDTANDHALDEAARAGLMGDMDAMRAWEQNAEAVEKMMTALPGEAEYKDFYWNIHDNIVKLDKYEEALAKAPDVLGDAAHPSLRELAKARTAAQDEAVRKATERSVRAAEDAEQFGPWEQVGPQYKTPKERVSYAKDRELDAQRVLDDVNVREMQAKRDLKSAKETAAEHASAKKAALKQDAKAEREAAQLAKTKGQLSVLGGISEFLDIPGLPKASDLPVVGPLLGVWLKYRALKAAVSKVAGRVPFNGDAKVAAMASKTRDRVVRAVDASLGLAEKGTKAAIDSRVAPNAARILATRIFDDGGENPPESAGVQKLAAARMREISAYAAHPNAIEMDVRRAFRDVSDPDVLLALEKQRRAMFVYLASKLPPMPEPNPLNPTSFLPSGSQAMSVARRMSAANDPGAVFEAIASGKGNVSMEEIETVRDLYKSHFATAQQRLMEGMTRLQVPVPLRQRVQMSIFYGMPLDPSMAPDNLQITQSVYTRKPSSPAYNPGAPGAAPQGPTAQPAIANPVNISQAYNPDVTRR